MIEILQPGRCFTHNSWPEPLVYLLSYKGSVSCFIPWTSANAWTTFASFLYMALSHLSQLSVGLLSSKKQVLDYECVKCRDQGFHECWVLPTQHRLVSDETSAQDRWLFITYWNIKHRYKWNTNVWSHKSKWSINFLEKFLKNEENNLSMGKPQGELGQAQRVSWIYWNYRLYE